MVRNKQLSEIRQFPNVKIFEDVSKTSLNLLGLLKRHPDYRCVYKSRSTYYEKGGKKIVQREHKRWKKLKRKQHSANGKSAPLIDIETTVQLNMDSSYNQFSYRDVTSGVYSTLYIKSSRALMRLTRERKNLRHSILHLNFRSLVSHINDLEALIYSPEHTRTYLVSLRLGHTDHEILRSMDIKILNKK